MSASPAPGQSAQAASEFSSVRKGSCGSGIEGQAPSASFHARSTTSRVPSDLPRGAVDSSRSDYNWASAGQAGNTKECRSGPRGAVFPSPSLMRNSRVWPPHSPSTSRLELGRSGFDNLEGVEGRRGVGRGRLARRRTRRRRQGAGASRTGLSPARRLGREARRANDKTDKKASTGSSTVDSKGGVGRGNAEGAVLSQSVPTWSHA